MALLRYIEKMLLTLEISYIIKVLLCFDASQPSALQEDILFFRKREEAINANVENTEWLSTGKTEEGFEVNNYYIRHPEMVLGTFAKETGLYGAEDVTVKPDGRELSEAISEAISRLPKDFYINPEYTEEADAKEEIEVDYDVKPMNLKAVNGKVYMRVGDSMVEQPLPPFPKDAYQRIADMIEYPLVPCKICA